MIYDKKTNKYFTKEELLENRNKNINKKHELNEKIIYLLEQILKELIEINNKLNTNGVKNEQSSK